MKKRWMCLLFVFVLLVGCGKQQQTGQELNILSTGHVMNATTSESDLQYALPSIHPSILTNRLGYEPLDSKVAIFLGEDLPETFTVRDAVTDQVVYTGSLDSGRYDEERQCAVSYGDFSMLVAEGDYYLQAEYVGESYPFMVHENLYYSLLRNITHHYHELRQSSVNGPQGGWQMDALGAQRELKAAETIYYLLLSYELSPENYQDNTEIPESGNEVPDILDECRYETGWLLSATEDSPSGEANACAWRCAVLAKIARLYEPYDAAFAAACLKAADNAYEVVHSSRDVAAGARLLAAAELFCGTGRMALEEETEAALGEVLEQSMVDETAFYGAVAAMRSTRPIDVGLCDQAIRQIMQEVGDLSSLARSDPYRVFRSTGTEEMESLLRQIARLCVVNYVIPNHEYDTIITNHVHYFMGRNPQGICHVNGWTGQETGADDIYQDPVITALFAFLLSNTI